MNGVTFKEIRVEMEKEAVRKAERAAEEERLAAEQRRAEAERAEPQAEAVRRRAEEQEEEDGAAERAAIELPRLQEKVMITSLSIKPDRTRHFMRAQVRSVLPWAISGIRTEVVSTSPGRSGPGGQESFILAIPGGIEPGETRELGSHIDRPRDTPEDVEGTAKVLDVAVSGWNEKPSPLNCLNADKARVICMTRWGR